MAAGPNCHQAIETRHRKMNETWIFSHEMDPFLLVLLSVFENSVLCTTGTAGHGKGIPVRAFFTFLMRPETSFFNQRSCLSRPDLLVWEPAGHPSSSPKKRR